MTLYLRKHLKSYEKHVAEHVERLRKGEESAAEAMRGFFKDTRRFAREVTHPPPNRQRKAAIHYVKRGMEAFNERNYHEAERVFRLAVHEDDTYARAHLYLGNTLFKRKRFTEAVTSWNRAVEVEPKSEAASEARGKLLRLGHGEGDVMSNLTDQLRS